jgi:general L-amino acid transport system permease protein
MNGSIANIARVRWERRHARDWMLNNLFSSQLNTVLSLLTVTVVTYAGFELVKWGLVNAAFGTTPESCAGVAGACWSVIGDFWRVFLVGLYPQAERWRAFLALGVIASLVLGAAHRTLRRRKGYFVAVACVIPLLILLLHGGVAGLAPVPTHYWGGLLISLGLAVIGLSAGIPLGIALALGRTSQRLPVIRAVSVLFIELVRSVPFIFILVVGAIIFPIFLPRGWNLDPLLRAQAAIIMSAAANAAEIVRGGLAGLDRGQMEAARALGLRTWFAMRLVVLPQVLRAMIPVFVSMFIIFFKDTSLVVAVGLFDLLGAAGLATANPEWMGRTIETYVFVGLIYFAISFIISRTGRHMEAQLAVW